MALNETIEKLHNVLKLLSDEGEQITSERSLLDQREKAINQKEAEIKQFQEELTKKVDEKIRIQESIAARNKTDNDNIERKLKELETRSPQIEERIQYLLDKEEYIKKDTAKLTALIEQTKDLAEREESCRKQAEINAKEANSNRTQRLILEEKALINEKERERLQNFAATIGLSK